MPGESDERSLSDAQNEGLLAPSECDSRPKTPYNLRRGVNRKVNYLKFLISEKVSI